MSQFFPTNGHIGASCGYKVGSIISDDNLSKVNTVGTKMWAYTGAENFAIDASGNVCIAYGYAPNGFKLCKLNSSGKILWSKSSDFLANYWAFYIAISKDGSIYIRTGDAIAPLMKLDGSGNVLWSKKIDDQTWQSNLATDRQGNIYLFCNTQVQKIDSEGSIIWTYSVVAKEIPQRLSFDTFGNVYVSERSGSVVKLGPDGGKLWTLESSAYHNDSRGVSVDAEGNIYIVYCSSPGSSIPEYISVEKLDSDRNTVWKKVDNKAASGITIDATGNIYVTYYQNTYGRDNKYIIKFDSSGNELWSLSDDSGDAVTPVYDPQGYLLFCYRKSGNYSIQKLAASTTYNIIS